MATLTKEEIKHIAGLSKLEFTDQELDKFAGEFNSILGYISMINECDTTGIEFEHNMQDYKGNVLQEDKIKPSLSQKAALQNATDGRSSHGYIITSKIINKE
jgi:aspartyl-tRNA(Asn)/glutamyl-tRNA(Gln) amidotransferase subunit C